MRKTKTGSILNGRTAEQLAEFKKHNHIYKKDRNATRRMICKCGHSYTPAS